MTLSVAELQPVLHDLFHDTADHLARHNLFCRRQRQLTGPVFAQTLVFSLLAKPDSTLEDFADFAAQHLGVCVTPNAFQQRFSDAAVGFLRDLLLAAFDRSFNSVRPALLPLLRNFHGVYVRDASLVSLPDSLADLFPARAGAAGTRQAALKLVLEMEVSTGQFTEMEILPALDNEKTSLVAAKPLPPGALLLEDMGFLCGQRLQDYVEQGVYVLTRVPCWTALFVKNARGKGFVRLDLLAWLRQARGSCLEREVYVFHQQKIALRVLAVRVPEEIAQQRRTQVRADAKKRGRPVSQRKLDLCDWNILVTNAPAPLLSASEAWEVRSVRWQIELVFKAFKSEGGLEQTQARTCFRVLSELYAKLLALVVQQWCLLSAGYGMLRHSLRRASRRVRQRAGTLLHALSGEPELQQQIEGLSRELRRCGIDKRRQKRSTFDRLAALDGEFRQLDHAA
jgi:hypothetical protein